MAGQRGRKKFEVFHHPKLKVTAQVYVLTDGDYKGHYSAEIGTARLRCPTLKELHTKLREAIEELHQLRWFPVLKIETSNPEDKHSGLRDEVELSLKYERYYVAKKPGDEWTSVRWDCKPDLRFRDSRTVYNRGSIDYDNLPFTKEHHGWQDRDLEIFLPYDEATWNALEWLNNQVGLFRDMISTALNSVDGRALMIDHAQKALPLIIPKENHKADEPIEPEEH